MISNSNKLNAKLGLSVGNNLQLIENVSVQLQENELIFVT